MKIKDAKRIFITGNNTEVGKTVVSAILVQALEADYWKPIQTGGDDDSDALMVSRLVSNNVSEVLPEAYLLPDPISPHAAAQREGIEITFEGLVLPETEKLLIIEGAGGILTPINKKQTMRDLALHFEAPTIVVSNHYLGSINHTLLTIEALREKNVPILGVVFVGDPDSESETAIISMGGVKMLGRVAWEDSISPVIVAQYARLFREVL